VAITNFQAYWSEGEVGRVESLRIEEFGSFGQPLD
jgi:hypothetical protein